MCKREELLAGLSKATRKYIEENNIAVLVSTAGTLIVKQTCGRCGGSGTYSYCQQYGTRCFACDVASNGTRIGYEYVSLEKYIARKKRQDRKAAKWAAECAARDAALEAERAKNGGLTDAEVAAQAAEAAAAAAKAEAGAAALAANGWLLEVLQNADGYGGGGFIDAMVAKLDGSNGSFNKVADLTDRMIAVLCDIYAKTKGRRGSKAYTAATLEFDAKANLEAV